MYFHSIRQHLAKCWLGASLLASLVCPVSAAASSNRMDGWALWESHSLFIPFTHCNGGIRSYLKPNILKGLALAVTAVPGLAWSQQSQFPAPSRRGRCWPTRAAPASAYGKTWCQGKSHHVMAKTCHVLFLIFQQSPSASSTGGTGWGEQSPIQGLQKNLCSRSVPHLGRLDMPSQKCSQEETSALAAPPVQIISVRPP